eukprot:750054-Hanusia_phi.AAC.2
MRLPLNKPLNRLLPSRYVDSGPTGRVTQRRLGPGPPGPGGSRRPPWHRGDRTRRRPRRPRRGSELARARSGRTPSDRTGPSDSDATVTNGPVAQWRGAARRCPAVAADHPARADLEPSSSRLAPLTGNEPQTACLGHWT